VENKISCTNGGFWKVIIVNTHWLTYILLTFIEEQWLFVDALSLVSLLLLMTLFEELDVQEIEL
jgi:hypothetical protein